MHCDQDCLSPDVWVSLGAERALALVAARLVDADGALLARVVQALVNVLAARQGAPSVAGLAQALWDKVGINNQSVVTK